MPMREKILRSVTPLIVVALTAVAFNGCNKPRTESTGPAPGPAARPASTPLSAFEQDLNYVRQGQFTHVYVFARRDGGVMNTEDVDYLKANSPSETNMWVRTDEGRRIIAGTNFAFKPEHFDALNKRFNIEDYSGK